MKDSETLPPEYTIPSTWEGDNKAKELVRDRIDQYLKMLGLMPEQLVKSRGRGWHMSEPGISIRFVDLPLGYRAKHSTQQANLRGRTVVDISTGWHRSDKVSIYSKAGESVDLVKVAAAYEEACKEIEAQTRSDEQKIANRSDAAYRLRLLMEEIDAPPNDHAAWTRIGAQEWERYETHNTVSGLELQIEATVEGPDNIRVMLAGRMPIEQLREFLPGILKQSGS